MIQFRRITEHFSGLWTRELNRKFLVLGAHVSALYDRFTGRKDAPVEDEELANLIMAHLDLGTFEETQLAPGFSTYYAAVGEETYKAISLRLGMNVAWNLNDPLARFVLTSGGTRLGLLDLGGDTKRGILRALSDARGAGEGPAQSSRRIRQYVSEGKFTGQGVNARSTIIARTETKYAQNVSSIAAYKESRVVTGLIAFDAQSTHTDEECIARNGTTFSFEDADKETGAEHPNGTLSWAPVVG